MDIRKKRLLENAKFCNCAECGEELVGRSNPPYTIQVLLARGHKLLSGRINDRPYCSTCLSTHQIPNLSQGNGLTPRQASKLHHTST